MLNIKLWKIVIKTPSGPNQDLKMNKKDMRIIFKHLYSWIILISNQGAKKIYKHYTELQFAAPPSSSNLHIYFACVNIKKQALPLLQN